MGAESERMVSVESGSFESERVAAVRNDITLARDLAASPAACGSSRHEPVNKHQSCAGSRDESRHTGSGRPMDILLAFKPGFTESARDQEGKWRHCPSGAFREGVFACCADLREKPGLRYGDCPGRGARSIEFVRDADQGCPGPVLGPARQRTRLIGEDLADRCGVRILRSRGS